MILLLVFCIFNLLRYDRIFSKDLEHDTYGVKEVLGPALCGGSVGGVVPEMYFSFVFHEAFQGLFCW